MGTLLHLRLSNRLDPDEWMFADVVPKALDLASLIHPQYPGR